MSNTPVESTNRLDEIIVFRKLTHDNMIDIVDLELNKLCERMLEKGYELEVNNATKDYLIENGTDEKFGARPLRRAIEQYLEDPLSEAMLRGEFIDKNKILITVIPAKKDDDQPTLKIKGMKVEKKDDQGEPETVSAHSDET